MAAPKAPWAIDKKPKGSQFIVYPTHHLLGLPNELKTKIYGFILADIHSSPRQWNRRFDTGYDGLLFACRELHTESSKYVFLHRATKAGLPKLLGMVPNKFNVDMLRALHLQISYQAGNQTFQGIAAVLDKFQLSIQELHLEFFGKDLNGNKLDVGGCGHIPASKCSSEHVGKGHTRQNFDAMFTFTRQLANLRNLRVLHIENLNMPVVQAMVLPNKPYLQAFCILNDPRSQTVDFNQLFYRRRDLFRGLMGKATGKTNVKVLELDANAVVPPELMVDMVCSTLEHLSWRAPNYDHQCTIFEAYSSFEENTCRIIQKLSTRAPGLRTLRLCITRRAFQDGQYRSSWETSAISQTLARYLPLYASLEALEIHDSVADQFYSETLIAVLPHTLKRLYISDRLIQVDSLVHWVRDRYILHEGEEVPLLFDFVDINTKDSELEGCAEDSEYSVWMTMSARDYVQFHDADAIRSFDTTSRLVRRSLVKQEDFLAAPDMLGDVQIRSDRIDFSTGKLGLIGYDYQVYTEDELEEFSHDNTYQETNRAKIFRLNGFLLDREHNMHLASTSDIGAPYGIRPKRASSSPKSTPPDETAAFSIYPDINRALHEIAQLKRCDQYVHETVENLTECFNTSMDWYFGEEHEAQIVFETERAAPITGQRQKSMLVEVEEKLTHRCRWWAPEYIVPPVASFPAPVVPRDWRDDIDKHGQVEEKH